MRRLRPPDYVVGVGGVVLFCSLFAPWTQLTDGTEDGWRSLALLDVWLLIVAGLAVTVTVVTALSDDPAPAIKTDVLVSWVLLVTVVRVLIKALGGVEWGGVLAAVTTIVTFAGCWWAMRLEAAPGLRTPPEVRAMPVPPETDPTHPAT